MLQHDICRTFMKYILLIKNIDEDSIILDYEKEGGGGYTIATL